MPHRTNKLVSISAILHIGTVGLARLFAKLNAGYEQIQSNWNTLMQCLQERGLTMSVTKEFVL